MDSASALPLTGVWMRLRQDCLKLRQCNGFGGSSRPGALLGGGGPVFGA